MPTRPHTKLCCLPRSPLRLPAVQADSLLFRPSIMLHGLLAHYVAEALLNAPQMIGSLELLLNPTGLLQSVGQGFADLIAMPLAAIEARSPSQVSSLQPMFQTDCLERSGSVLPKQQTSRSVLDFILHSHMHKADGTTACSRRFLSTGSLDQWYPAPKCCCTLQYLGSVWLQFIWGMGAGSASLVRHVSGWTLASISGFTGAFSRVLIRAVVARGQERCGLQVAKMHMQSCC